MAFKIGIDVGGTFTDFLVTDESGKGRVFKTPTTPREPATGVFSGLQRAAADYGMSLSEYLGQVDTIVHGTTITTNATLTGEGAKTGFITTQGFRDILNMRRGLKERQYDCKYAPPPPLVPRYLIQGVKERVDVTGQELVPLSEADVKAAVDLYRQEGVEAIAVSFLWSFFNPGHERRVREICEAEMPGVYVSLSSEILPQIRVYERHSTTALNAYVGPPLSRYLKDLQTRLGNNGFGGTLLIMQSNGGVMSPELASRFASNTLLSGPAGGPVAGVFYGDIHGFADIITIDMGGTSFDACLVRDRKPSITVDGEVGGYRLASAITNIHTIGAGGGSIAWIDAGNILQVGPKSAGADPGPVCYDYGGTEPTVTDADLILGYLDPDSFFGGELKLNRAKAEQAIKEKIADPLGIDVVTAANGIYRVINANMAAALSVVSVQQGYDPREFALVVAGGAGPLHAAMIAREMDIPLIVVPRESSVFCAAGMLLSDLKHNYVRTSAMPAGAVDLDRVNALYNEMAAESTATLKAEGIPASRIVLARSADLRYIGQFHEVEVPTPGDGQIAAESLAQLIEAFHQQHDALYGYALPGALVELINLRISAQGITDKPSFEKQAHQGTDASVALKSYRDVYFTVANAFVHTPIYDGLKMGAGHVVKGPAIIEQPTTTIVVTPDYDLVCDEYANYVMYPKGSDLQEIAAHLRRR